MKPYPYDAKKFMPQRYLQGCERCGVSVTNARYWRQGNFIVTTAMLHRRERVEAFEIAGVAKCWPSRRKPKGKDPGDRFDLNRGVRIATCRMLAPYIHEPQLQAMVSSEGPVSSVQSDA